MVLSEEPQGFLDYIIKGQITDDFIRDFYQLTLKIYSNWVLKTEYEDFRDFCVDKLFLRIEHYDPKKGTIGTYLYNLILNEARRLYSREKHEAVLTSELEETLPSFNNDRVHHALIVFLSLAASKGIYLSYNNIYASYQTQDSSPYGKAFSWLLAKERI